MKILRIACAGNQHNIMGVAADALSTLQVENEKLRDELEQVKRERDAAIADLLRNFYADETSEITKEQWDWLLVRFTRKED